MTLKPARVKGSFSAKGLKIAIVVSQFNEYLTNQLLEGALDTLSRHGARSRDVRVIYVPGAFEIPLAVQKIVHNKNVDAVITLAVVIRGKTKHFDQVAMEAARGIREISMASRVPVILGMIPAESEKDAIERVGLKQTNKGREWAMAAIETANVLKKL